MESSSRHLTVSGGQLASWISNKRKVLVNEHGIYPAEAILYIEPQPGLPSRGTAGRPDAKSLNLQPH